MACKRAAGGAWGCSLPARRWRQRGAVLQEMANVSSWRRAAARVGPSRRRGDISLPVMFLASPACSGGHDRRARFSSISSWPRAPRNALRPASPCSRGLLPHHRRTSAEATTSAALGGIHLWPSQKNEVADQERGCAWKRRRDASPAPTPQTLRRHRGARG